MNRTIAFASLLGGLLVATAAGAQAPAGAPAGATGQCKDGSYWTNPTKKGACRGHKGVQTWYAGEGAAASTTPVPASTAGARAPTPGPMPAGATGLCKDGTYWTNTTKQGACRGHKGIQTWFAGAAGSAAATPARPAPAAPTVAAATPTPAAATAAKKAAPAPAAAAASGGGPGLVWVNTPSHVDHCSTDRWYGKTKTGAYMSEAAAKAEGDHADHGKACQ
jgi:hypothetical protein